MTCWVRSTPVTVLFLFKFAQKLECFQKPKNWILQKTLKSWLISRTIPIIICDSNLFRERMLKMAKNVLSSAHFNAYFFFIVWLITKSFYIRNGQKCPKVYLVQLSFLSNKGFYYICFSNGIVINKKSKLAPIVKSSTAQNLTLTIFTLWFNKFVHDKNVKNGQKWPKMAKNGLHWSKSGFVLYSTWLSELVLICYWWQFHCWNRNNKHHIRQKPSFRTYLKRLFD